jgi:CubicO group peptidase (beta-lactamase class C family)
MNTLRNTGQRTPQNAPFARRVMLGTACAALAILAVACGDDADDDATDDVTTATDVTTTEAAQTVTTSDPPTTTAPTTDPPEPPPTTAEEAPDPNIELAAQIEEMLTEALAPGSIRWVGSSGVEVPATAAVAAVRIPGRDDLLVAAGENIDGTPVEPDAPFPVSHLAVSLVRTVAFQLIDEGVLDPALTVDQWAPALPNADRVTVRMLLDDQTGWGDYGIIEPDPVLSDFERVWTLRDAVELRATVATVLDEPGTATVDSFMNETVLFFVVEEVGGQPLADLVRDRVTGPAGLDDTGLVAGVELPAGFRHGVFAFTGTPVATSDFDPTSYYTWEATQGSVSTPTDLLDLLEVWATGELFTTDRTPAPSRYESEPVLDVDGDPWIVRGVELPFTGFCPCPEVADGREPAAFGRGPAGFGTLTFLLRYADGISIVLNVNSNENEATDVQAVADAIHELAAASS